MPIPPSARSSERVSCTNRSKARSSRSGVIPTPRSRTRTTASSFSTAASTSIVLPAFEYFAALFSRLPNTWTRRAGSASTRIAPPVLVTESRCARSAMSGRLTSTARWTTDARSSTSRRSAIFPWLTRETSSRSSSNRFMCPTCRPITSRAIAEVSASSGARRRISTALRMGAMGLRSSCESIARNSSLRRSISFNSASARARSRSSSRRCVSSVMTATQPSTPPPASQVGETTKCIQRRPTGGG